MFIPFLPVIVIYAILLAFPALELPWPAVEPLATGAGYALLLMTGLVVGNLPERWVGPPNPLRMNRRKLAHMALWMGLATWSPVYGGLARLLGELHLPSECVALAMLANYWLADALAQHPLVERGDPDGPPVAQRRPRVRWPARVWSTMRIALPVMGLLAVLAAGTTLWDALAPQTGLQNPPWWLATFGTVALYLLVMGTLVPLLIRYGWGLQPIQSAVANAAIREELGANAIRGITVLAWPEHLMRYATAGVIGLLPGFRILLFGDSLANVCTPGEIRAVTAHEAAHIRQGHLWYYLAAIVALLVGLQVVFFQVVTGGLLLGVEIPADALIVAEIVALLLFLRFGVGYLSRGFERQADAHALVRWGLDDFRGALTKLSALNRISMHQANWHHFGIAQRLAFLQAAQSDPPLLARHHRHVGRTKLLILLALALALGAQGVISATDVVGFVPEGLWLQRFQAMQEPTPTALHAVKLLAARAHQRGDLAQAQALFQQWLRWAPDDPVAQNNLGWLLVTRAESSPHDLAQGLRLARQAAQRSSLAFIWDTLAEAYWRNGERASALQAAQQALALARAGQGAGDMPVSYYLERLTQFGGGAEPRH